MARYETTQAQWQALMGTSPSYFKGSSRPVERVSWNDAQAFLARLNALNDGYRYRLPTEAEWEYAARAGTTGANYGSIYDIAWIVLNSSLETHPAGQKQPNPWGLYDMLGNVWEWVQDWYDADYYGSSPAADPPGPASGTARVLRGFAFGYQTGDPAYESTSCRGSAAPESSSLLYGFRCVREK
jgi:formylglycine-generating enzyme required for sulfatase activity